jgi:hypothetical protein
MPELQMPDIAGNFLSSYYTAQQKQQADADRQRNMQRQDVADERQSQQFDMQMDLGKLEMAQKQTAALNDILSGVDTANPASLDMAKQRFLQTFGGDPQAVAGITMADIPRIKMQTGQTAAELDLQYKRAQIAAQKANAAQSYAAADYSRRRSASPATAGGVTVDPETGALIVTPGMSNMKLTEGQSKDIAFLNRASAANAKLDADRTAALVSTKNALGRNVPFVGNALQSSSSRQGMQIGKDFIAAVLRKDTGAAVTDTEFDFYSDIFLPQWGDDAEALALKEQSRKSFLDGMRSGLSNGASLARMGVVPPPELAAAGGTQPPPAGGAGAPATTTPPLPPGFRISQ